MSTLPIVMTLTEVADHLLTTPEKLLKEIERGRLRAFAIGDDDWRVTQTAMLAFMGEAGQAPASRPKRGTRASGRAASLDVDYPSIDWHPVEPFEFQWPDEKLESMDMGYSARISIGGETRSITVGYTKRYAAGMERRRAVVFLGEPPARLKPIVEFVGSNDFDATGHMASPIKVKATGSGGWKLTQNADVLPLEYSAFKIASYRDIVDGPNAYRSLAVVVDKDDLAGMVRYALIRCQWKGWI